MTTLLAPTGSLRRYLGEPARHSHDHAQILLGLHGSLELEIEGRAARIDPTCGLLIPPGAAHLYQARRAAQVWVIDAPADAGLARLRHFALPPGWSTASPAAELLDLARAAPRALPRRALDPELIAQQLAGRLHEAWPTTRLAALVALSPSQFHARWLALTGRTPQDWLRDRRLDAATRLLRQGCALDAAALQVGYRSASALGVALQRERGTGARQLRRR